MCYGKTAFWKNAVLQQRLLVIILNALQIVNNLIISYNHVCTWLPVDSNAVKPVPELGKLLPHM